ncbi:hypothetical protein CGZ95_08985 [Enemella evansiae]|uniref:ParB/Srx family N-terminal domain-containing protein n=1 Tax=Enemella evansiae TaxID=2016499 RepID=UPI000B96BC48|nr:ParB/Srx family N-terminal domain-containing protein [Enemella evansiae]OYO00747.1 hypothetical protein CGZ95_08985 [Enemella evansiae]
MVTYSATTVPLAELLLDPNNFRFRQPGPLVAIAETRFHEEKVQSAALERIKNDGVNELKRSISENGFVPVERIVVRKIEGVEDGNSPLYVVIEGNRRTAALKLLQFEHAGGIDLPESVAEVFSAVPVLLANDASSEDLLAIMGIRHVGGPKEWGGYQSALLVYEMINDGELSSREVASRLSLTVNEVNRRHRAFSTLSQMMASDEFAESVTPEMYPIFHEAVGQPSIRGWLGWDAREQLFTDDENRELFYSWLVSDGDKPKISSYSEVRDLKQILDNDDALTALKDDDQTFADALAIVKADAKAVRWLPNAKSALTSLNEMGSDTIEGLDAEAIDVLKKLQARAGWIVRANRISEEQLDSE